MIVDIRIVEARSDERKRMLLLKAEGRGKSEGTARVVELRSRLQRGKDSRTMVDGSWTDLGKAEARSRSGFRASLQGIETHSVADWRRGRRG